MRAGKNFWDRLPGFAGPTTPSDKCVVSLRAFIGLSRSRLAGNGVRARAERWMRQMQKGDKPRGRVGKVAGCQLLNDSTTETRPMP